MEQSYENKDIVKKWIGQFYYGCKVKVYEPQYRAEQFMSDGFLIRYVIHYKMGKICGIDNRMDLLFIEYNDEVVEILNGEQCLHVYKWNYNKIGQGYVRFLKDENKPCSFHECCCNLEEITTKEDFHSYVMRTNKYKDKTIFN